MRRIVCLVAFVLLVALATYAAETTVLYHTFKLSDTEVGINCRSGGVPGLTRLGNLVVVSCVR